MIIPDFVRLTEAGIYCKTGDFYLDPQRAVRTAVVSHAHGDHVAPGCVDVYATPPTMAFIQLRYKKYAGKVLHEMPFQSSFTLNGVRITFYPAGHILGSAMVLMEWEGIRYLYTGDFKMQHDPTCETILPVQADVLITETTFADPQVQHPDPVEEIRKLNDMGGQNIIIGAYVLGKAQRLTELVMTHCPEKKLRIHYQVLPYQHIYNRFGMSNVRGEVLDKKELKTEQNLVYIVPPMTYHSYLQRRDFRMIFASGWERLQEHNTSKLFISDHADWAELNRLIGEVKPSQIWTLHGDGRQLRSHLEGKIQVHILNHD